jgi:hypothetical protein
MMCKRCTSDVHVTCLYMKKQKENTEESQH